MGDLLIRDLPPGTHEELKRRAERAGMSLQSYVSRVLEQHADAPTLSDWLSGLDDLPRHREIGGAEVIRAVRDEAP